ncbi:MAG: 30S ribosomal protein S2 [Candidatus Magasanikbacteria bacterium CG10_big_fil_rev_8_21_14_0_10_40_10]|uniref:Small ribosomal subunit protein uS2 n=1 Tax=Candidatus Magasanikbacteria bacterium CG10_big_fil_rev_8_21_14_0_10_40_10 TaxID=1974648 RepID=A0A2M6W2X8_9BACT|nr:MAG: 30S ribosomal protein S2 [Candidatus Magasanikbacteria bacterium CG10_big_fil_rev_8_21_14_0_10_40_10]
MEVTLLDMLKSGVHFGHQTERWHPKMKQYIFGSRAGVHIIDLEKTLAMLEAAQTFAKKLSSEGKIILFVATKRQAKEIVKKYALEAGMPYLIERWIGGFLTNFGVVSRNMQRLRKLKSDFKTGEMAKYKKHEQMEFQEEIDRLQFLIGGVEHMETPPDALFIIDIKKESTAVAEAKKRGIPVIALVDTNTNPKDITYPIPSNDDATKAIDLMCAVMADTITEGRNKKPQTEKPLEKIKKETFKKEEKK